MFTIFEQLSTAQKRLATLSTIINKSPGKYRNLEDAYRTVQHYLAYMTKLLIQSPRTLTPQSQRALKKISKDLRKIQQLIKNRSRLRFSSRVTVHEIDAAGKQRSFAKHKKRREERRQRQRRAEHTLNLWLNRLEPMSEGWPDDSSGLSQMNVDTTGLTPESMQLDNSIGSDDGNQDRQVADIMMSLSSSTA